MQPSLNLRLGKILSVLGIGSTHTNWDKHCNRNVVLEHLAFDMGGHCDMAPFTCIEFNLQFTNSTRHL